LTVIDIGLKCLPIWRLSSPKPPTPGLMTPVEAAPSMEDYFMTANMWLARLARPSRSVAHVLWSRWTPLRIIAGAALILVAVATVVVSTDVWAVTAVRRLPFTLVSAFDELTDFGKSGWFLIPLGVFVLGVAVSFPMLPRTTGLVLASLGLRATFLFCAIAVPGLFTLVVKYMIGRARPYVTGVADPYAFSPLIWQVEYSSLPSGHATSAFSAPVAIGTIWPRLRVVMWTYAIAVAASRVIVTSHYPSDVMASAVVGVLGAVLVRNYFAARGLALGIRSDGAAYPFTGPSLMRIKSVMRWASQGTA
jgi:membrane-associated phospholipid phosphatase